MADTLAIIGDGGCVSALPAGSVGQVLTQGAAGVAWLNAADDQTASEVEFTPYGSITETTVQGAIQNIELNFCEKTQDCMNTALAPFATYDDNAGTFALGSINAHSDVDTTTSAPTAADALVFDGTNWVPDRPQKIVANAGATLPINDETDAGTQALWNGSYNDVSAESNDIVPVINASGERQWRKRIVGALAFDHPATSVGPLGWANVPFATLSYLDAGLTYNAALGQFTVGVPGRYMVSALVSFATLQNWAVDASNMPNGFIIALSVFVNNVKAIGLDERAWFGANLYPSLRISGSAILNLAAGDTVHVAVIHFQPANKDLDTSGGNTNHVSIIRL